MSAAPPPDTGNYRVAYDNAMRRAVEANDRAEGFRRERDEYRRKFEALQRLNDSRDREVRNAAYERAAEVLENDFPQAKGTLLYIRDVLKEEQ